MSSGGGTAGHPECAQGEQKGCGVGEHVTGVGEERQAPGPEAAHDLGHGVRARQPEHDPEPAPVVCPIEPGAGMHVGVRAGVRVRVGHPGGVYAPLREAHRPRRR